MRLYGTEGGFARREGAPAWRGEVCLFAPAELEAAHLPACVRLLLPAQARYCRAGTEGAALVGAVKRSAGNFTFALWEGNLAVCDEGGFVQGVFTYPMLVYAVVLIVIIMFRPRGIFGTYEFSLLRSPKDLAKLFKKRGAKKNEGKEAAAQ